MPNNKVKIKIDGDDKEFREKMSGLGSAAEKGAKIISKAFVAATGALTATAATVISLGSEFETTAAKASTLFGDVNVDANNLNKKILEISSSTGKAATELNEALYSALSAGIPVTEDMAEATAFVEKSTKLAIAGFTDTDTAISATAKTLNAYGLDVSETDRIQGILIQTQNKGITTVGELGASLAQVTPTAAAFNVSFENVGAALATMTAQGTPTAQATTQLNQLIAELGKNGTTAAKNLQKAAQGTKYAGKSFNEIMESGASLSDVLELIQKEADKNNVSMVDMFSSIEAGKAALSIASGESKKFNENLEDMKNTAGMVDDAFETMTDTFEGQAAKIKESAKNIAISIYETLKDPLKDSMKEANGALEEFQNYLSTPEMQAKLQALGKAIGDLIQKLIQLGTDIAPEIIDALIWLAENIDTCAVAFVSFKVAMSVGSIISTVTKSIQGLNMAVGAASKAQAIYNAVLKANPYVLAATAIAALVAGIYALTKSTKDSGESMDELGDKSDELSREIEEFNEKSREQKRAYDEMVDARKKSVQDIQSEYVYYQKLVDELSNITDENGNVISGYEARAATITGILSDALGKEITTDQLVAQGKQNVIDKINELLVAKRNEAQLSAYEESYSDAMKKTTAASVEYTQAQANLKTESDKLAQANKNLADAQKKVDDATNPLQKIEYKNQVIEAKKAVEEATESEKKAAQTLKEKQSAYFDYLNTIKNYEGATAAIIEGDSAKIDAAMNLLTNNFVHAENATKESLENQVMNMRATLANLKAALEDGLPGVTQAMVDNAQDMVNKAEAELTKFESMGKNAGEKGGQATADGLSSKEGGVSASASKLAEAAKKGTGKLVPLTNQAGENAGQSVADGLSSKFDAVSSAATGLSYTANNGINSIIPQFGIAGENSGQGFVSGIKTAIPNTQQALSQLPGIINSALGTSIKGVSVQGSDLIATFENGMTQTIPNAVSVAENGSQLVVDGLAVANSLAPQKGADYINGVIKGLESKRAALISKAQSLANSMNTAFAAEVRINSPSKDGEDNGEWYIKGIEIGLENESANLNDIAKKTAEGMNDAFLSGCNSKISDIRSVIGSVTGIISKENENKQKSYQAELDKIDMLHDFGIDNEETYYSKLEFIRDNYLTKYSDTWIDATKKIYNYQLDKVEESKKKAEEAHEKELDDLERKLNREIISEAEYYRELERIRDYYEVGSDDWYKLDDEIFDYNKRLIEDEKEAIKDTYNEISDFINKKLDDIMDKQKSFGENLVKNSHVYEHVTIDAGDQSMDYYRLNNFEDELENAKKYRELLTKTMDRVKASGVSESAIKGIMSKIDELGNDADGIGYLEALLAAADSEFKDYMSTYAELIDTEQGTAAMRYSDEMADAATESYQYMKDELEKAGLEIPESFFTSGTVSAEKFGEAFVKELDIQMGEIQSKILSFNAQLGAALGAGKTIVTHNNLTTTYQINAYDAADAVTQIKNYETVKRLSGA